MLSQFYAKKFDSLLKHTNNPQKFTLSRFDNKANTRDDNSSTVQPQKTNKCTIRSEIKKRGPTSGLDCSTSLGLTPKGHTFS